MINKDYKINKTKTTKTSLTMIPVNSPSTNKPPSKTLINLKPKLFPDKPTTSTSTTPRTLITKINQSTT
jgi:hypothetical protein